MVLVLTLVFFGLAMLGLALGIMIGRRGPAGGCGREKPLGPDGQPLTCDRCTCAPGSSAPAESSSFPPP